MTTLSAQGGRIRPGAIPGTERWVAVLAGRSFDLRARLDAIRREPARARREILLDEVRQAVATDQHEFGQVVIAIGGRVAQKFWTISACVVEIPPTAVRGLRTHPRVVRLVPDEEREHGSVGALLYPKSNVPPSARVSLPPSSQPYYNGTDEWNHNVVGPNGAHGILGHKGNGGVGGQRAYVAVFDSGVDLDQSGHLVSPGPDDHHYAFRTGLSQASSRIVTNTLVGEVDCNWAGDQTFPAVDPWCPFPLKYPTARHGTGVAGIILGQADPVWAVGGLALPPYFPAGHAEDARLLSFAITNRAANNPTFATWPTSEATIVAAVQALATHMLVTGDPCHVLNISYHMWPDPDDPTQLALDHLEREFDVLVVTLAGNEGDATIESPGLTNGITVGNAHKFTSATGRYPHRLSSRGPLLGDPERYFPDVCASGSHGGGYAFVEPDPGTGFEIAHIIMPLIDYQVGTCNRYQGVNFYELNRGDYNAPGSSMASPQVAGAAALYRAERASATAQETKAALLLGTIDPFLQKVGGTDPHHTYVGRNNYGVGYVRDDLVARYGKRTGQALEQMLGQTVSLTVQAPNAMVPYTGLTPDAHYAVAIAWPRRFPEAEVLENPWSNVDLEVRRTTGEVLARSDSLRNLHERLVFKAAGTTAVEVHVLGRSLAVDPIPVFVAARPIASDGPVESRRSIPGYVERIAQEPACAATVREQAIRVVLPSTYTEAWGSMPLRMSSAPEASTDPYWGGGLASTSGATVVSVVYDASVLGLPAGQNSYWVRALALRTWRPLTGCAATLAFSEVRMQRTAGPIAPIPVANPLLEGVIVAQNVSVPVHAPVWDARNWHTWPIVVPLDQPFEVRAGENLQVWMRTTAAPCGIYVDAVGDGSPLYRTVSSNVVYRDPGDAPILGLIEESVATVGPELDLMGFPSVGRTILFGLRQCGGSASTPSLAAITIGTSNPNVLLSPCRLLSSGEIVLPTFATQPMGHGFVPFPLPADSTQIHKRYFAQAVVFVGGVQGPVLFTNGVRFTIGGVLP